MAPGKRIILVYASRDEDWRHRLEDCLVVRTNDRERFPAGLSVEAWSDEYLAESARAPDTLRDEVENVAVMLFLVSDDLLGSPCVRDESIASVLQIILLEERSVVRRLSGFIAVWRRRSSGLKSITPRFDSNRSKCWYFHSDVHRKTIPCKYICIVELECP